MIKNYWENLALREKQTAILGIICSVFFLCYEIIWAPLSNRVSTLRQSITHKQQLLAWMQETDKNITQLQQTHPMAVRKTDSLLSTIQTQLNNSSFTNNISRLQQIENDSVQLHLQNISFDNLMTWLINLNSQGVSIQQIDIVANPTPGIVESDLIFHI
jgi:general secretion pathway protein M